MARSPDAEAELLRAMTVALLDVCEAVRAVLQCQVEQSKVLQELAEGTNTSLWKLCDALPALQSVFGEQLEGLREVSAKSRAVSQDVERLLRQVGQSSESLRRLKKSGRETIQ